MNWKNIFWILAITTVLSSCGIFRNKSKTINTASSTSKVEVDTSMSKTNIDRKEVESTKEFIDSSIVRNYEKTVKQGGKFTAHGYLKYGIQELEADGESVIVFLDSLSKTLSVIVDKRDEVSYRYGDINKRVYGKDSVVENITSVKEHKQTGKTKEETKVKEKDKKTTYRPSTKVILGIIVLFIIIVIIRKNKFIKS